MPKRDPNNLPKRKPMTTGDFFKKLKKGEHKKEFDATKVNYEVGYKKPPVSSRWKKGEAPKRPPVSTENLIKRQITRQLVNEVVATALSADIESLKQIVNDPQSPALKVGIAVSLLRAIQKGDWHVLELIVQRVVGKVPDEVIIGKSFIDDALNLTPEERKAQIKALELALNRDTQPE